MTKLITVPAGVPAAKNKKSQDKNENKLKNATRKHEYGFQD